MREPSPLISLIFYSDDEGDYWMKVVDGLPPVSKGGHYRILR